MNHLFSFYVVFTLLFLSIGLSNCKSSKSSQKATEQVHTIIPDVPKPILVDLKGQIHPSVVISGLQKYGLKVVKQVNKEANQWVFIYNPEVVSADEILKVLKYEQWMDDAWFYVE